MSPVDVPLAVLAVAFALALVRIAVGPTLPDRIIATELAMVLLLGTMALLAVRLQAVHPLTVALVAALLQFIATSGLTAMYLRAEERRRGS